MMVKCAESILPKASFGGLGLNLIFHLLKREIYFQQIWLEFEYPRFHLVSSVTQLCPTLCDPMNRSIPGLPVHHQLLEFTWTHVHWLSDAIQSSHPLLSPSPPTLNLFQHQGLFNESVVCIKWPKYCSFSFSISLSNEYSGLISLRIDWFDLLVVQETLKSLL